MRKVRSVIFTKEFEGRERLFEAIASDIGASMKMFSAENEPGEFINYKTRRIDEIGDKRVKVTMWGSNEKSPWGGNTFEVEYQSIIYKD